MFINVNEPASWTNKVIVTFIFHLNISDYRLENRQGLVQKNEQRNRDKAFAYLSNWLWNTIFTAEFDKPDCRLHANKMSGWYEDWIWCRVRAAQCLPAATSFTTDLTQTSHMDMHCQLADVSVSMNWKFSYEEPCSMTTCMWYLWLNLLQGQLNVDLDQLNSNMTLLLLPPLLLLLVLLLLLLLLIIIIIITTVW